MRLRRGEETSKGQVSVVVSFHCCNGIAEAVNLEGEQAYFGSWPWRFWSTEL